MRITRTETTMVPRCLFGKKFADEYEERLKSQGAFRDRKEDVHGIAIYAEYVFDLKEEEE